MATIKVGIIDDGYPTYDSQISVEEISKLTLLNDEWGSEIDLRDLNIRLVGESTRWKRKIHLEAFKHPNFYFNKKDWAWDFLVFDWEYKPEADSQAYLYELLSLTNCPVYIYTAWDKIDDIPRILEDDRFSKFKEVNRYHVLNKSEKTSEDTILNSILEAFKKGETINWQGLDFTLFPSKYVVDEDDFWKLQFLLGSENLKNLIKKTGTVNEETIITFFTQSNYKFFIDEHKKVLSSSANQLLESYLGKLTGLSMIDALKSVGIDKMEEAKEKGYTDIK